MNVNEEPIQSAVARTSEAIKRRTEEAKTVAEANQQRAQDDHVIGQVQKRIALLSRECGSLEDVIQEHDRDISVAEKQIAVLTAGVARHKVAREERRKEAVPLAKELSELRAVLRGVDQEGNQQ